MITDRYNKAIFPIEPVDYRIIEVMMGRKLEFIGDVRVIKEESAKIANDWIKINFRKGE